MPQNSKLTGFWEATVSRGCCIVIGIKVKTHYLLEHVFWENPFVRHDFVAEINRANACEPDQRNQIIQNLLELGKIFFAPCLNISTKFWQLSSTPHDHLVPDFNIIHMQFCMAKQGPEYIVFE